RRDERAFGQAGERPDDRVGTVVVDERALVAGSRAAAARELQLSARQCHGADGRQLTATRERLAGVWMQRLDELATVAERRVGRGDDAGWAADDRLRARSVH